MHHRFGRAGSRRPRPAEQPDAEVRTSRRQRCPARAQCTARARRGVSEGLRVPRALPQIAIVVMGLSAYSNVGQVPLLFDDVPAIAANETIRNLSPSTLTPPQNTTLAGRPFANLTFALN